MSRRLHLPAIATVGTTPGQDGAEGLGQAVGVGHIRPQHHGPAIAVLGGAGVNKDALGHGDSGGLVSAIAAMPVSTHQHRAALGGTAGVDDQGVVQIDVVTRQRDITGLAITAARTHHRAAAQDHR